MEKQWTSLAPPALDPAVLARVRSAAHRELAQQPSPRSWRVDVLIFLACTTLFTVAVALVLRLAGNWAVASAAERARTLSLLFAVQLLGGWGALAPRARRSQLAALVLAGAAMLSIVLLRETGAASPLPQWVCTVSHLGLALGPLAAVLLLLRRAALSSLRVLAGGAAVGAIGAVMGEVACGQDAAHVALFHLPAWLGAMALAWAVSRRLRPRSFAP